jgi:hypothetical protein
MNCVLPKIPGMGFGEELLRTDFRKRQLLNCKTEVSRSNGPSKASPPQTFDTMRVANTQLGESAPNKITLDRKVLRFQGFFKEGVHESPQEQERLRKCIVYYFLEDDTISVSETKQDNSGIPGQGALIKRHQVPRPDGGSFSFEDFNIGRSVSFYGKTFYLTDCDVFTRRFLTGMGIEVPQPEEFPEDQYTETRRKLNASMIPRRGKAANDEMDFGDSGAGGRRTKLTADEIAGTKQFLAHDKKVLRFYCIWDDRTSLYGDVRLFTLQYFLSDDTIEVTETNPPNCGRDPFPSFIKRSRVPKTFDGKFINPSASLTFKKEAVEYFTDADLMIGVTVNVYGRSFQIYDCDEFTQMHLRSKYSITDFTPIDVRQPGPPSVTVEPPPYNGFGDEQDSLGSWKYLVMKAPKKDVKKYMEHANHQLKFQLRLEGGDSSNAIRVFVLTYFLADDTLSIFEPAQRNSGIIGGKFLQRSRVKKAVTDGLPSASGDYIGPQDLYVGARVIINNHPFVVYSTDERSLVFMEQNPEQFPKCNMDVITTKLRAMLLSKNAGLRIAFENADKDRSGTLDFMEFASIIETLHLDLSEQEMLTLMRHYDKNSDGQISWQEFVSSVLPPEIESQYAKMKQQTWEEIRSFAEQQEADELDRFRTEMAGSVKRLNYVTDLSFKQFLDKYNQRRVLFHDTFKVVADHSPDGHIGEPEFRKAIQKVLKLDFPENTLKALCMKLFPPTSRRIPLTEFKRILAGTSSVRVA